MFETLAPNTPIIVGIGSCQVRSDNPEDCPEAYQLMVNALKLAAEDTGKPDITKELESIAIQRGSWKYKNPGLLIAEALGCPQAKTIMSEIGVLQMTTFFELCQAIREGEVSMGACTGGETRYRDLRSMITGIEVHETGQGDETPEPDVFYRTPDAFSSDLEAERGVWAPGEFYAIAQSAKRHAQGLGIEEHRDKIAAIYEGFSKTASENPHSWLQEALSANEIRNPAGKNSMIAFPYTKRMLSQWNVNQSVGVIVCSYQKAQELGLDQNKWIFPVSAVQSRHVVTLAQKPTLHTHPGTKLTGKRAMELADTTPDTLDIADIYSCFPVSIEVAIDDMQLNPEMPLSITGGMAFAGGPYNHGALDSIARMAEVLREYERDDKKQGMVTNISGMFGKQAAGIFSNQPATNNYQFEDVTDTIRAQEIPIPLEPDYTGEARIVGYSVMYNKGEISHAIAYADTGNNTRTVVRTDDKALASLMTQEEFVGRIIEVRDGGDFIPVDKQCEAV